MRTFGVAEAKRRFSELIDRVRQGERFLVKRRGSPAVALVPPDDVADEIERSPAGLLGLVGALSDVEGFDSTMHDVVRSRRRAKDRPVPEIE